MTGTVACDVSEFQVGVDDTYNRDWLIFRICDGDYIDQKAAHNLAWSNAARASGKLKGFTVYVVYRPGKNNAILHILDSMGVPHDCVVMIDAESWGGQISGDHSSELNALATSLRARQGGRSDLVWAYGNRGPDISVWPNKATWLGWVVASYGGGNPSAANEIGWQYTDGQYAVDGLPSSSPPFGRCDHNILYKLPEEDMPLDPHDPVIVALNKKIDSTYARIWECIAIAINGDAAHPYSQATEGPTLAAIQKSLAELAAQATKPQTATVAASGDIPVTGTLHYGP